MKNYTTPRTLADAEFHVGYPLHHRSKSMNDSLGMRTLKVGSAFVAAYMLTLGGYKLVHAEEIVMPTVTVTGSMGPGAPGPAPSILSNSYVPAGARPIYGGNINEYGGAGTIVGYRVPNGSLQPGAPLIAAGAAVGIVGIAVGSPALGAVAGVAAATGTIANTGAAPAVTAGTVVMLPPNQRIAPINVGKFGGNRN